MSTMERAQIEDILRSSKEKGASDVHLTAGSPPVFRVNGTLIAYGTDKLKPVIIDGFVQSLITEEMYLQLKQDRDIDFSFGVTGVARYRVNCFYQRGALSMAFRTIPTEVPTLEQLSLPPVLKRFLTKPHGTARRSRLDGLSFIDAGLTNESHRHTNARLNQWFNCDSCFDIRRRGARSTVLNRYGPNCTY